MSNSKLNDKLVFRIIFAFSAVIFITILVLSMLPKTDIVPAYASFLPKLNAMLNATCSVLLVASYYNIRKKNVETHKKINITAFVLSALFLVSYVWFHSFGIKTQYPMESAMRPVYLFILITHIILAAVVLPLVLISFYYGITMQVKKHRRLTRWSFPIWLYVTVTGVIVYMMISPYYQF